MKLRLYLSIYCLLLISNSLSETWKNCLEGATDFKEVKSKPCVCVLWQFNTEDHIHRAATVSLDRCESSRYR